MTDCLCCIGCCDLKLRYLSEWVDLRYTAESKWPLGERLINRSENGRHPFSFSNVNWMELSIVFKKCVLKDMFENILFPKRANGSDQIKSSMFFFLQFYIQVVEMLHFVSQNPTTSFIIS